MKHNYTSVAHREPLFDIVIQVLETEYHILLIISYGHYIESYLQSNILQFQIIYFVIGLLVVSRQ